jgi:hypothetical protein
MQRCEFPASCYKQATEANEEKADFAWRSITFSEGRRGKNLRQKQKPDAHEHVKQWKAPEHCRYARGDVVEERKYAKLFLVAIY